MRPRIQKMDALAGDDLLERITAGRHTDPSLFYYQYAPRDVWVVVDYDGHVPYVDNVASEEEAIRYLEASEVYLYPPHPSVPPSLPLD